MFSIKFDYIEKEYSTEEQKVAAQLIALCNEFKNIRDYENANRAWYAAFAHIYDSHTMTSYPVADAYPFSLTLETEENEWGEPTYYYDLLVIEVAGLYANMPVPLVNQQVWIEIAYLGVAVKNVYREQHERIYNDAPNGWRESLKQELESIIEERHLDIKRYQGKENIWQLDN